MYAFLFLQSLELFSVIGGYMGMWLGISLLNVYDFFGTVIGVIRAYRKRKRSQKRNLKLKRGRSPPHYGQNSNYVTSHPSRTEIYRRSKRKTVW